MKIDKVILSSDDNPIYLDFWEVVSGVWQELFDIEPILLYFGDGNPSTKFGKIIYFDKNDYSPSLNTLWSRYWYPQKEPETTFIISDIDMIPMSKYYFIEQLKDIEEEKYVHLVGYHRPIPSCYHLAKGKLFKKILELPEKFEDCLDMITKSNIGMTYNVPFSNKLEKQWGSDEEYATKKIENYMKENSKQFVMINRAPRTNRLDRANWRYSKEEILNHKFYDCHSIRPYFNFKTEIDKVINILKNSYSKV